MRKPFNIYMTVLFAALLVFLCACSNIKRSGDLAPQAELTLQTPTASHASSEQSAEAISPLTKASASGELVISFDYTHQSGYASNQFAVWIEDARGVHIKTLYATRYTANGGFKDRPDSIPAWVEKSGLATLEKSEADAVSGATPKTGALEYSWDLTDANGEAVVPGDYLFFVEGSLRWKNRVLYSGAITLGDAPASAQAAAEFFYEATSSQPALSDGAPESAMIGAVAASFSPAE